MAVAKDRKVYALDKFLGLDKENKPTKIQPKRAYDGNNFVLDSRTLKTRPAFKYHEKPTFNLLNNEHIIDWYKFQHLVVYITNKAIMIEVQKGEDDLPIFHDEFIGDMIFDNLEPFFHEEKDCLFIFGLNDIFVIAPLWEGEKVKHVFTYRLNEKPQNVFTLESDNHFAKMYDELPTAYEPTLFIDGKSFEDINLLSNVSKYKLFAQNETKKDSNYITYFLPTHYDKEKHGDIEIEGEMNENNYDITFYKDLYDDNSIIPVFIGVKDEDFADLTLYGNELTSTAEIEETFYPLATYEYIELTPEIIGNPDATPPIQAEPAVIIKTSGVSGLTGLTKEQFFNFKVKGTTKRVLEYLIDIIRLKKPSLTENKTVKFILNIKYNERVRDINGEVVLRETIKTDTVEAYAQLKGFENLEVKYKNDALYKSSQTFGEIGAVDLTGAHAIPEGNDLTISSETIIVDSLNDTKFMELFDNYIQNHQSLFTDAQYFSFEGTFAKKAINAGDEKFSFRNYISSAETSITYGETCGFAFPSFDNPEDFARYELQGGDCVKLFGETIDLTSLTVRYKIEEKIRTEIRKLVLANPSFTSQNAFMKMYVKTSWREEETTFAKAVSIVVPFTYEKAFSISTYLKQKVILICEMDLVSAATKVLVKPYNFTYEEREHAFKLELKDYFVDYNNEPAIDVRVEFDKNPDYQLIANAKFGITFGSENRIFLADGTNIDRYNVSNDLLGNNIKNQSYETTYFPSKNYRVIGGKGGINGYVVSADTQLYVTKEEYANDQKVFIRERIIDDDGILRYNEYKTSINQTPINNKCIVRFLNDVVMLTKNGLFAFQITNNVLTNERLIKPRDSFVTKYLVEKIKTCDNVHMVENNQKLYMFIGESIFVADNRYVHVFQDSPTENMVYEIVEWKIKTPFKLAKFEDNDLILLKEQGDLFLKLEELQDYDDTPTIHKGQGFIKEIIINEENVAKNSVTPIVRTAFISNNVVDEEILKYKSVAFILQNIIGEDSKDYSYKKLYVSCMFDFYDNIDENWYKYYMLVPYKVEEYVLLERLQTESAYMYYARIQEYLDNCLVYSSSFSSQNLIVIGEEKVKMTWTSAMFDFNNNMMEKTMFKTFIHGSKLSNNNTIKIGYRTMRRSKSIEETRRFAVPTMFNFEELDFRMFGVSTMSEYGMSIPTKENNFLYIQFLIEAEGQVELNSIEILYKMNRLLKTIG